jgi:hypothetical protein
MKVRRHARKADPVSALCGTALVRERDRPHPARQTHVIDIDTSGAMHMETSTGIVPVL